MISPTSALALLACGDIRNSVRPKLNRPVVGIDTLNKHMLLAAATVVEATSAGNYITATRSTVFARTSPRRHRR